jgi:hypothetical protein
LRVVAPVDVELGELDAVPVVVVLELTLEGLADDELVPAGAELDAGADGVEEGAEED